MQTAEDKIRASVADMTTEQLKHRLGEIRLLRRSGGKKRAKEENPEDILSRLKALPKDMQLKAIQEMGVKIDDKE